MLNLKKFQKFLNFSRRILNVVKPSKNHQIFANRQSVRQAYIRRSEIHFLKNFFRIIAWIFAKYKNLSVIRSYKAQKHMYCRGFPGAIRPEKTQHFSFLYIKGYSINSFYFSKLFFYVSCFKKHRKFITY